MSGKPLQGYLTKKGSGLALTGWKGNDLGWRLHRVVKRFTVPPEYEYHTTEAVILVKEGKTSVRYAAGYSLGTGMLFRGVVLDGSAKWGTRAEADLVEEAGQEAISESEYWMQKDQEAQEEDEARMREEEETYGRDPRRRRAKKRTTRRRRHR
jgi:hypothetical protein